VEPAVSGALDAFIDALGAEAVLTSPEALAEFGDPYAHPGWLASAASAVVQPSSVEEVQAVVRIAGEHGVPLWTTSQGRNNGYGGSAPRVDGSVVVNLRRMNRVLEIDEEHAYAVVEPGVSFFDLYEAVRGAGHRLWISTPDLGWGSVVGNTLDHGVGYTANGDHPAAQCGMEVVLADGSLLRTGMGAMEGNRAWHVHKRGFGPSADGLFMQSNFGIVTKMGVWLQPEPEVYRASWLRVGAHEDIVALLDALRPLMLDGTISGHPVVGFALGYAAMTSRRSDWYDGDGPLPEEVFDRMAAHFGIGRWNARIPLWGHAEVVEANHRLLARAASTIPGAWLEERTYPGDARAEDVHPADEVPGGHPNLHMLERLKFYGPEGGHLAFAPVMPLAGRNAAEIDALLRPTLARHGLDYNAAFLLGRRSAVFTSLIFYERTDEAHVRAAYAACDELVREAAKLGYGEYRAHTAFMDLVAEQYGWGDRALARLHQRLKDALDPQGILSPGKQGIWPSGPSRVGNVPAQEQQNFATGTGRLRG
jgi:4-cresol dehydrogenase (hydroxylating) flavoprotein subunit